MSTSFSNLTTPVLRELDEIKKLLDSPVHLRQVTPDRSPHLAPRESPSLRSSIFNGNSTMNSSRIQAQAPANQPQAARRILDQSQATYKSMIENVDQALDIVKRAVANEERDFDDMLHRTRDIDRSVLLRKDAEIDDLRKVISSKERALDSLREIMTVQKRNLEAKVSESEAQMARVTAELRELRDRIGRLQSDNASLETRVQEEERQKAQSQAKIRELQAAQGQLEKDMRLERTHVEEARAHGEREARAERQKVEELRQQAEDLKAQLEAVHRERSELLRDRSEASSERAELLRGRQELLAALSDLQRDRDRTEEEARAAARKAEGRAKENEALRAEVARLESTLQMESYKKKKAIEKLHREREKKSDTAAVEEALRRLQHERKTRHAMEKWLHAELRSREEMDSLFVAIRDLALASTKTSRSTDTARDLVRRYDSRLESDRKERENLKSDVFSAVREAEKSTNMVRDRLDEIKASITQQLASGR